MLKMVFLDSAKTPKKFADNLENKLRNLGSLVSYPNTNTEEIVKRSKDAEVILTNKVPINKDTLHQLINYGKLKYIVVVATGYDNVDIDTANQLGILVSNVPDYSSIIVAQHTIALLLELTNQVGIINDKIKQEKKWHGYNHTHTELAGLTLGLVGFGAIAKRVARIAAAFGMNIIISSRRNDYITDLPITFVDINTLFSISDVISLHCPLNSSTREIINENSLKLMKPNALIINTARGGLINEKDLYESLSNNLTQKAALDVLNVEPPVANNPLFELSNCIISPHNGWLSEATLLRWVDIIINNVNSYIKKQPINLI